MEETVRKQRDKIEDLEEQLEEAPDVAASDMVMQLELEVARLKREKDEDRETISGLNQKLFAIQTAKRKAEALAAFGGGGVVGEKAKASMKTVVITNSPTTPAEAGKRLLQWLRSPRPVRCR